MTDWTYTEKPLRKDVKDNLPSVWSLRVFQVTSGDSGNTYWVQVMSSIVYPNTITLCDCPEGKFLAPLIALGAEAFMCKHAMKLLIYLKEKEEKTGWKTE